MKNFSKKEKRRMLGTALKRHIKKRLGILGWIILIAIVIVVCIFIMGIVAYQEMEERLPNFNAGYVFAIGACWIMSVLIGCSIVWGIVWLVSTEIKSIQEELEKEEHRQICKAEAKKSAEEKV